VSPPPNPTYTVLSCHFGDPFWISHLLTTLEGFADPRIQSVVVVDQSRSSQGLLTGLPGVIDVLEFPADDSQMDIGGHDHPASLDRALTTYPFATSHVILLDSDAFPVSPEWLDHVSDITLAQVPGSEGELTHPCFMVFPVGAIKDMNFSEGFMDRLDHDTRVAFDTGRMIGRQLREAGHTVATTPATPGFGGFRGDYYLDGQVYHHGHASHTAVRKDLQVFVSAETEEIWKKKIARGDMTLSLRDYGRLGLAYLTRRVANKVEKFRRA